MLDRNVPESGYEMIPNPGVDKGKEKNRRPIMEERTIQKVVQKARFCVIFPFPFPLLEVIPSSLLLW